MSKVALVGASLAVSIAAVIVFGSVVAQAASDPNVVGEKYSDATGALSSAGLSVVSTTVGDTVARPDCIVTRQQARTQPAPQNTSASPTNQVLLSLDCGAPVASATSSGNSLASPEGQGRCDNRSLGTAVSKRLDVYKLRHVNTEAVYYQKRK